MQQLRTEQQLGYIAHAMPDKRRATLGIEIVLQSSEYGPQKLYDSIAAFVAGFKNTVLSKVSEEELETVKSGIQGQLLEKPKSVADYVNMRTLGEVISRRYNFNSKEEIAEEVSRVQLDDVLELFKNVFTGNTRHELVVAVHSSGSERIEVPDSETQIDAL